MFWRHEIVVPPGFEAAVNAAVVSRRPLYVGRYDQVHFLSFAPVFLEVNAEANCPEGIAFSFVGRIRLQIPPSQLSGVLKDTGYSTYRAVVRLSAEEVAKRQNVVMSVKAAMETFARQAPFFDLLAAEQVRVALNQRVQDECGHASLAGELVSVSAAPVFPDADLLAGLRARAATDPSLAPIVEYFREALRQKELVVEEVERAKATMRADTKIVEQDEAERIKAHQEELSEAEAERQRRGHKRNSELKEGSAKYEFAYRMRRLDDDMALAAAEAKVSAAREAEKAASRQQRRLDRELDVWQEEAMSAIRSSERQRAVAELATLVGTLSAVPGQRYEGAHTVVTLGQDWRDQITGSLAALLTKYAGEATTSGPAVR